MTKISGSTFFFKKLFPSFWFGFLFLFFIIGLSSGAHNKSPMFLIMPIFMAVVGFVISKKLLWDLADVVYDEGDSLLFKKGSKEQRVPLQQIINISSSTMTSPERITISVREAGELGDEISFLPPMRIFPITQNPLTRELIKRVDSARNT